MNWRIIRVLIGKDLLLYFRDKFYGFITIFSILLYLGIFFIMPGAVDEIIKIGVNAPQLSFSASQFSELGITFRQLTSEEELREAIKDKTLHIGLAIPRDIQKSFNADKRTEVKVYIPSDLPDEIKDLYNILVGEILNEISGNQLHITHSEEVLGADLGGRQIPLRERMIPLLILMLIVTGTLGLANFITLELERGTYQALSVTPLKVTDFFISKGLTGLILAFSQALLIMAITGSLGQHLFLMVTVLLLGSIMAIGLALFIASISKDMMAVVAWGTLLIIVFLIPAFTIMFPGQISVWIKAIPSYFFVDILNRTVNFNAGWGGNLNSLLFLALSSLFFVSLGITTIQRKVKCT